MPIYTKILIGMLVGAAWGLLLGPKSAFLEADGYHVAHAEQLAIFAQEPGQVAADNLRLPMGQGSVALKILSQKTTQVQPPSDLTQGGEQQTLVPVDVALWSHVSFRWTPEMALRQSGDTAVYQALGGPKVGDTIKAWLKRDLRWVEGQALVSPAPVSLLGSRLMSWLQPVGNAFMRLIKMVIVPLVFASLVAGIAQMGDPRALGRLGGKTLAIYMTTTAIAVAIGLGCAHLISPGEFITPLARAGLEAQFSGAAGVKLDAAAQSPAAIDTLLGIIPTNPAAALAEGNMLQIIFFALILGVALTVIPGGESLAALFTRLQDAMVVIIQWVMATAPIGVAALVAVVVGEAGWSVLGGLVAYGATVVLGLLLHCLVVYGGLLRFGAGLDGRTFLKAARPAQLLAFSTSSSSAALPATMNAAEKGLGIPKSISSFVLPLGSTINMDGTALYQGVAAVFIAQVFQIDLSFSMQLGIVLTATAASIGAAGVPGAGMVTLALVLTSAGIPTLGVALILGMDRLLDMFRTAVNVTGDLTVTATMARRG